MSTFLTEYYEIRPYFGTTVWIHCFYKPGIDIAGVSRACWQKAENIQQNINVHAGLKEGNLAWLNALGFEGVRVQADLYKILSRSMEYARLTNGAYDMTIFPLVKLWQEAAVNNRLPDPDTINIAKAKVGYQNLRFVAPDQVFFMKKGLMIDLGSPASGYFCDEVAAIMEEAGVEHFMVDGGGEIFARGLNKGEYAWKVGVQDPFHKEKVLQDIELNGRGVSTSGNYEKFALINGQKYAHIIDPRSGYPQTGAASVTVIADSTQAANEMSTALCVMGGARGIEFVRAQKNVEALIVENVEGRLAFYRTNAFL
ncbi:MAG: FAD:protein FMN transferase [Candidatus Omnitrophica bacterium]|nr:FAD:protein FMN transferase [Candidatus Omnitrophota bacterium]